MTTKFFDWAKNVGDNAESGTGEFKGAFGLTLGNSLQSYFPGQHQHVFGSAYRLLCQPSAMLTPGFLQFFSSLAGLIGKEVPGFTMGGGNVTFNYGRNATANYFGPVINIRRGPVINRQTDAWFSGALLKGSSAPSAHGSPTPPGTHPAPDDEGSLPPDEPAQTHFKPDDDGSDGGGSLPPDEPAQTHFKPDDDGSDGGGSEPPAEPAQSHFKPDDGGSEPALESDDAPPPAALPAHAADPGYETPDLPGPILKVDAAGQPKMPNPDLPPEARPDLSHNEETAVQMYTGDWYKELNENLRNPGALDEVRAAMHQYLQDAFNKITGPFSVTTYRGMSVPEDVAAEILGNLQGAMDNNTAYEQQGYASSTTNEGVADGFLASGTGIQIKFEIEAKQGLDVSPATFFDNERELLLNHKSQFKVLAIQGSPPGPYRVSLEQIVVPTPTSSGSGSGDSIDLASNVTSSAQQKIDEAVGLVVIPLSYLLCGVAAATDFTIKSIYQTQSKNFPDETLPNPQGEPAPNGSSSSAASATAGSEPSASEQQTAQRLFDLSSKTLIPTLMEIILQLEQIVFVLDQLIGLAADVKGLKESWVAAAQSKHAALERIKLVAEIIKKTLEFAATAQGIYYQIKQLIQGLGDLKEVWPALKGGVDLAGGKSDGQAETPAAKKQTDVQKKVTRKSLKGLMLTTAKA